MTVSLFNSAIMQPQIATDEAWNERQQRIQKLNLARMEYFENVLRANPPLPPWEQYPEYSRNDLFWCTGEGSEYLRDIIWPFNRYSTKNARKSYRLTYPAPQHWAGWYSEVY